MTIEPRDVPQDVDLESVWQNIAGHVWSTPAGRFERLAVWCLRSPGLARALVKTPSLLLSWLLASAAILSIGVVATAGTGVNWVAFVAPALAGIAVAFAYGPGIDPAFELSQSMAISDRMVLLVRVLAVFAVNALLGVLASFVTSSAVQLTFGWLIPMTTIAALGLAVATASRSAPTGAAAAIAAWSICILGGAMVGGDVQTAIEAGSLQFVYAIATALLLGVTLVMTGRTRPGWLQ